MLPRSNCKGCGARELTLSYFAEHRTAGTAWPGAGPPAGSLGTAETGAVKINFSSWSRPLAAAAAYCFHLGTSVSSSSFPS